MHTRKILTTSLKTGAQLVILLAMLTALVSNFTPALAAPRVGTVSVGSQTGTLTTGTTGSVSYLITVTNGTTQSLLANLTITGLPAGASGSFSPSSLTWTTGTPSGTARTSTLTVTTTAAAAAGVTTFTVRATRSTDSTDFATGNGTLTIGKKTATVTFGAAPAPTYPGSNFTVSATTTSDGVLSYGYVSGPCSLISASAGTFSPTGVGTCVVSASTPETAVYMAGSTQQAVSISNAAPANAIHLCATTGSVTMPDNTNVPVWSYVKGDCTGNPAASLPGATITVNQGDNVSIVLHNNLTETTAISIPGMAMKPDLTGATPNGGTKTYTFTATNPGTYLYEAGLLPNAEHQIAMGLYGALIVRSGATGQAYNDPATAYNDEAVLVLSEIDPSLNAAPASFDMRYFAPKYFLINGKAFPGTAAISTAAGNKVLLRYVNAGVDYHSMSVLGVYQTLIALGGNPVPFQRRMVADTIAPGQTLDAIVTIPASAVAGSKFAIYDGNLMLHNSNTTGFGGMMSFLSLAAGGGSGDVTGPSTGVISLSPNPTNGTVNVSISAPISDVNSGNANVTAAEFFIDTIGLNGAGTAMSGSFGSPSVTVNATLSPALLATLTSGNHNIYVHGQDSLGNWGPTNFAVLNLDKSGPTTTGVVVSPSPTNGSVNVTLTATGNDTATGNSNVVAAEYFIDPSGTPANGSGTAMTVSSPAPTASLTATLAAATVNGLNEGNHTVSVRSRDSFGNWGALSPVNLVVDKTGPATSNVVAAPNPNNGALPYNTNNQAVHLTATLADTTANISSGEAFIDTVGANGSGILMVPADGQFNGLSEGAYVDIPLTTINQLSSGNHNLYVHGKDVAGNWGPTSVTVLVIDKAAPTTSGVTLNPTASNNTAVSVSATTSDTATGNSNITNGEYFIDATGANGAGTALTVSPVAPSATLSGTISGSTVGALSTGNHTVYVHGRDAAGNWSAFASAVLLIDRTTPTLTGITLNPNSFVAGSVSTVTLTVNGASDGAGGSGVTGGEYWINPPTSTAPAPGGGTQFSGTTANISVGSLTAGTYTVNARIRDLAGNWSSISTATMTISGAIPDAIFSDGFEAGNTNAWSSRSTTNTNRLNVTTTAKLVGTYGMQAQGSNTNYVQYNFGTSTNPATGTFDARFYFNPNGNSGTNQDIFSAATSSAFSTVVFRVRYRLNAGTPQVQIQIGNTANATWTNITNGSTRIEVVWQAVGSGGPNPGTLVLYVNGVNAQTLTTTSTSTIGAFRMGSVISGGNATLEYFDAFSAKRSTSPLVGP